MAQAVKCLPHKHWDLNLIPEPISPFFKGKKGEGGRKGGRKKGGTDVLVSIVISELEKERQVHP